MHDVRVFAESREGNELLLSWLWPEQGDASREIAADARSVAATIGILDGVSSARPEGDGVAVIVDPEKTSKAELAAAVRRALAQEDDLKARSNAMIKRIPKYASLAAALALDERLSPVPEVARQTAARRVAAPVRTAVPLRMVPGLPLITQIHSFIPVMRSLRSWSRTASPDVVEQHFINAGLDRSQLDVDLATAHEAIAFARAYAADTASRVTERATDVATQARDRTRAWIQTQQAKNRQDDSSS